MSNRNSNLTRNLTRTFPEPNPNTMDYKKIHEHILQEHDLFLFEDEIKEIVRVVLEMDDQKIFNHMYDEHDLLLLQSQMREIIDIVLEMHNGNPGTCTINESTTFYSKLQIADILRGIKESQKYGTKYIYLRKDYDVIACVNPLTDKECEAIGAEFMFKLQTIK